MWCDVVLFWISKQWWLTELNKDVFSRVQCNRLKILPHQDFDWSFVPVLWDLLRLEVRLQPKNNELLSLRLLYDCVFLSLCVCLCLLPWQNHPQPPGTTASVNLLWTPLYWGWTSFLSPCWWCVQWGRRSWTPQSNSAHEKWPDSHQLKWTVSTHET